MKRPHIVFFSQTGQEIVDLQKSLSISPDLIVTNKPINKVGGIHKDIDEVYHIPFKPTVEDYENILQQFSNPIITLHGYLRIIPAEICKKYDIYNGHPGLITRYPRLKGKDPQVRAWKEIKQGNMKFAGSVVHRVTEHVDEGEVKTEVVIETERIQSLDQLFTRLRTTSLLAWEAFFREKELDLK